MKRIENNLYSVFEQSNLLNSIRLRHGLRWQRSTPGATEAKQFLRSLFYVALIILAYGVVGRLDYEAELASEAAKQEAAASRMSGTLADCLNGSAVFTYDDPTPLPGGHGKIAVVCRKAEEVRV